MNFMKYALAVITLVFLVTSVKAGQEDQPASGELLKQQTYELLTTLKDYSLQQKDELMEALEQSLDDLDERIDVLQERIDEHWDDMSQSARDHADATLSALRQQRIKLQQAYEGLMDSSGSAWEQMKAGFGQAYKEINHSWEKAIQEYH
jgi:uncharacterized protein YdcH (DUF465 family)